MKNALFWVFVVNFSVFFGQKTTFPKTSRTVLVLFIVTFILSNKARVSLALVRCWRHSFLLIHTGTQKWSVWNSKKKHCFRLAFVGFGNVSLVDSVGVSVQLHDKRAKQGSQSVPNFIFSHKWWYFFKYGARTLVPWLFGIIFMYRLLKMWSLVS